MSDLPQVEPLSDAELAEYWADGTVPPRFDGYAEAKLAVQRACLHEGWSFKKHGRCCWKCGTFMVDWGD